MDEFPLPTLGPKLRAVRDEVILGKGFHLIRGFPVERFDRWQTAAAYYSFGLYWGKPQAQNAKGHILCHIKVRAIAPPGGQSWPDAPACAIAPPGSGARGEGPCPPAPACRPRITAGVRPALRPVPSSEPPRPLLPPGHRH